jgi:TPR repeat protein
MDKFEEVLTKADSGDPDAQFRTGSMLFHGENTEKDS